MRFEKKTLSNNPTGSLLSISDLVVIHTVPETVVYEEMWLYAVNPNDYPIWIVLKVSGIPDEVIKVEVGNIPYNIAAKSLDPGDSVEISTKEEIKITGYVNRSTKI